MRVTLTPYTISILEEVSGKKITRNGDEIIREVVKMAETLDNGKSVEMTVCDNTKMEMSKND